VRQSILARQPVTEFAPTSDAAIYLQRIVRKLVGSRAEAASPSPDGATSARSS
jgi:MinD-like ATPase involved in chromosome partitioning or flagellar assembly